MSVMQNMRRYMMNHETLKKSSTHVKTIFLLLPILRLTSSPNLWSQISLKINKYSQKDSQVHFAVEM